MTATTTSASRTSLTTQYTIDMLQRRIEMLEAVKAQFPYLRFNENVGSSGISLYNGGLSMIVGNAQSSGLRVSADVQNVHLIDKIVCSGHRYDGRLAHAAIIASVTLSEPRSSIPGLSPRRWEVIVFDARDVELVTIDSVWLRLEHALDILPAKFWYQAVEYCGKIRRETSRRQRRELGELADRIEELKRDRRGSSRERY